MITVASPGLQNSDLTPDSVYVDSQPGRKFSLLHESQLAAMWKGRNKIWHLLDSLSSFRVRLECSGRFFFGEPLFESG